MTIEERYAAAGKLMLKHTKKAVLNGRPSIQWLDDDTLYYAEDVRTEDGVQTRFVKVDCKTGEKSPLFDHEKLIALLREKGMACSVYVAQFLLESCFAGGLDELGVSLMTSRGKCSWLHMMEQGATVTMEAWDNQRKPNQDWSHPWGAAPGNIIPRHVVGVRPLAPGFLRFQVKPSPAAPRSLVFRQPTPFGAILVQKEGDALAVSLRETERKLRETAPGEYLVEE